MRSAKGNESSCAASVCSTFAHARLALAAIRVPARKSASHQVKRCGSNPARNSKRSELATRCCTFPPNEKLNWPLQSQARQLMLSPSRKLKNRIQVLIHRFQPAHLLQPLRTGEIQCLIADNS